MKIGILNSLSILFLVMNITNALAQLSPGELSKAHAHLEGLSNCSKCHAVGNRETTAKCLECHREIQSLISQKKGYHASTEVAGKKCSVCHGEHVGREFKIVRFDEKKFNHQLSGYKLEGKHKQLDCFNCHKKELIKTPVSQKKGSTYLGLGTTCLSCHADYHQGTLNKECATCHNQDAFRPATGFNHAKTKFPLIGKHQSVECGQCHKTTEKNGNSFRQYAGVASGKCTDCHKDIHEGKFGMDCRKCHNEFSFHQVKSLGTFNHNNTDFPLQGKHLQVECSKCHKESYTKALKHNRCIDCHSDYHEKQFSHSGISPDCSDCHTVENFSTSVFTFEKHSRTDFPLEGPHLATPCIKCHKVGTNWNFRISGAKCTGCHLNIHEKYIDQEYLPDNNCKACHKVSSWDVITFNHTATSFPLSGKHAETSCRKCHFREYSQSNPVQQFNWPVKGCANCHPDIHQGQFLKDSTNDCERCHSFADWNPVRFIHNNTRFKLEGKHVGLACSKCHKTEHNLSGSFRNYKIQNFTCAGCH